jgi:ABC-type multidrug transport system ATPase subunit
MCDELVILSKGQLVFQGTVDQLLAKQVGLVAIAKDVNSHGALVGLCRAAGFEAEDRQGSVLVHAPASWASDLNQAAMRAGIVLRELRAQAGDLEETVLTMTGKGTI